jgi:hypothetical protein
LRFKVVRWALLNCGFVLCSMVTMSTKLFTAVNVVTLRTHGCVLSIRVSEHDSLVHLQFFHGNVSVTLLCGSFCFIVAWGRLFSLLR